MQSLPDFRRLPLGIAVLLLSSFPAQARQRPGTAAQKANMPKIFADFNYVPDIVYKTVAGKALQLDLLIPKNLPKTPAPLLVHIHGGGWAGGNRYILELPDHAGIVQRCGKAGIICATIEYRLADGKSTAFDSVVDCKDALRYLVKHAKEHHIDAGRIATFGGSAGGHLSLMTALGDPKDFPGDPTLVGCDPTSLRAEVALYPATDFTDASLAGIFLTPKWAKILFGGTAQQQADQARRLSPMRLIRKTSTPVYLFHGEKDTVLSVENSRRLFQKGKAVGADIQYTEVKNSGHGFRPGCTPSVKEIDQMAARFLIERLTRPRPSTKAARNRGSF